MNIGDGFAWAGQSNAKLLFSCFVNVHEDDSDENLGAVLPSGSATMSIALCN